MFLNETHLSSNNKRLCSHSVDGASENWIRFGFTSDKTKFYVNLLRLLQRLKVILLKIAIIQMGGACTAMKLIRIRFEINFLPFLYFLSFILDFCISFLFFYNKLKLNAFRSLQPASNKSLPFWRPCVIATYALDDNSLNHL